MWRNTQKQLIAPYELRKKKFMSHRLFNFHLRDLKEIQPWGGNRLSWFGLTDGVYYMQVGTQKLFESSQEILKYWKEEYPQTDFTQPYVDYQIVRLYEDLLNILPSVLEPIPKQQQELIATMENEHSWWDLIQTNLEQIDDDNNKWLDAYYEATGWWGARNLSTMHLSFSPKIVLWRYEDIVTIRWDNTNAIEKNMPVWSASQGEIKLSLEDFMAEVNKFHNQLMSEMQARVDAIASKNPISNVNIDIPRLLEEQREREQSLRIELNRPHQPTNWDEIATYNQLVSKQPK